MNTDATAPAEATAAKSSPRCAASSPSQIKEEVSDPIEPQNPIENPAVENPAATTEKSAAENNDHPTESAESPAAQPENFDATVRVAKDSSVHRLITFVMSRLEGDGKVTIQALNLCVRKAIMLASIARDRLGNVYQVNSLLVVQEGSAPSESAKADDNNDEGADKMRTTSGI